jgi:hypothetical protein
MDEYVSKLDDVCNKMMKDKFGKLIDLERIELIVVNQQIEELKQRMIENEYDHEKVMQDWLVSFVFFCFKEIIILKLFNQFKSKISNEKDESIDILKANTKRINEMIDVLVETKRIEKNLDAKQTVLVRFFF